MSSSGVRLPAATQAMVDTSVAAATAPANLRNPITGYVNVKAFGAKGDGVNADTGLIHNARNYAGAGGTLYFPPGTYIVDGVTATLNNQTWQLHPEAVLKQKDNASTLSTLKVNPGVSGFTLLGGTLDGNYTNQTGGHLSHWSGITDAVVRGVTFKNARTWAMAIGGSTRVSVRDCTFLNCVSGVGQAFWSGTYGPCYDIEFIGNLVDMRAQPLGNLNVGGFTSYGNAAAHNQRVNISQNRIFVNKDTVSSNTGCIGVLYTDYATVTANVCNGSGISISIAGGSSYTTVASNVMSGYFDYGLEFASTTDCSASGNIIDATGANKFCISLSDNSARTVLTGNTLTATATASQQAVNLGASTDTNLTGNTIRMASIASGVILNGSSRVTATGNTFLGAGVAEAGLKAIGSAGEITVTGNRFRDMTAAAVKIDAVSAITTDHVMVTGNTAVNCPAVVAVTGAATLGANALTTGNVT